MDYQVTFDNSKADGDEAGSMNLAAQINAISQQMREKISTACNESASLTFIDVSFDCRTIKFEEFRGCFNFLVLYILTILIV